MKILYCKNCGELYSLKGHSEKSCTCGRTSGILEGELAKYKGDPFLVTISDQSLSNGLLKQIQLQITEPQVIETFLMSPQSAAFKQVDE